MIILFRLIMYRRFKQDQSRKELQQRKSPVIVTLTKNVTYKPCKEHCGTFYHPPFKILIVLLQFSSPFVFIWFHVSITLLLTHVYGPFIYNRGGWSVCVLCMNLIK